MTDSVESSDRQSTDFVLFALSFFGYLTGIAGVVLTCVPIALAGGLVTLLTLLALAAREAAHDR